MTKMNATTKPQYEKSDWALVAIGVLKLLKGAILLMLGIALVHWRDQDLGQIASRWIAHMWLGRAYFELLLTKLSLVRKESIEGFAIGAFVYSALLATEGVGLCLRKRWAEFLTVGITASLLPFEFYELYQQLTTPRMVITLLNLTILVYLVARLWRDQ